MVSKQYNLSQSIRILFISLVGMALGAKIFGCFTGIYRDVGVGKAITLDSILDTGIVYYGGLLGLIATYSICLRSKRCVLDIHALDVLAVCFPLFHMIARIGCFLSGCCYGKICHCIFSVAYTSIIEGCVDINSRIPVQLIESLLELTIFIYLYCLLRSKSWESKHLLFKYLFIYSVCRFFLEFLRGDVRRGLIHGVSFSQCISVMIWITLFCFYLKRNTSKHKEDYNGYDFVMDD